MQFSTKTFDPSLKTACLILSVAGAKQFCSLGSAIDKALGGVLSQALSGGDLSPKLGATWMVTNASKNLPRILLVGTGKEKTLSAQDFGVICKAAASALQASAAKEVVSALGSAARDSGAEALRIEVQAVNEAHYRFEQFKTKDKRPAAALQKWQLHAPTSAASKLALEQASAISAGIALAKDLGNSPGNVCTPSFLATTAQKMGKSLKMEVQVLEEKQMRKLGMGSFLAVAQGSAQAPKMIVMHYRGASAKQAPIALIGKGITFDTGGISIKPAPEMDEMKFDMCGAASVLGTMQAVAQMRLPINVIGVVPTCENMPSSTAVKPGDIVTSMSGQTIEILNTDAEGRLILCDAMTYTATFKPAVMIDIATLTGACVIALGHHHSGLFSKQETLTEQLLAAGRASGDTCWHMPMDDAYQESLKSNFADMGNVGGRAGGSITAACFLSRFTSNIAWAHLDIAGTAWKSGAAKGASGRPVGLLTRYLMNLSSK
jgi:leucyl aminopeptidase